MELFSREMEGTIETVNYLKERLKPGDKVLRTHSDIKFLTLYGGIKTPRVSYSGDLEKLRSEVAEKGFAQTMKSYNIKYYVNVGRGDFKSLLPLYDEKYRPILKNRSNMIEQRNEDIGYVEAEMTYRIDENVLDDFLEVEKRIGDYWLYKIR